MDTANKFRYLNTKNCQNRMTDTSNVIGRHWGPNRKLRVGYRAPSWHASPMCCQSYVCLLDVPSLCARHVFFIVECDIVRYAYIRGSGIILAPRLSLCEILSQRPLQS